VDIFVQLFVKLLPLYFIILLGYFAGKKLNVSRDSIAPLLIYIVVPIVNFKVIFEMDISQKTLIYPIYLFIVGVTLSIIFFQIGKYRFKNNESAALLSLTSTLANTGYFGLPLLLVLYGEHILGTAVLINFGLALHESTVGFYLAAHGKHSPQEALIKTFKIPILYAVTLALLSNYFYNNYFISLTESPFKNLANIFIQNSLSMMNFFIGTLTVLGMSIIGLGLAKITRLKFNWQFIGLSLFSKYLVYPLIFLVFYSLNSRLGFFDEDFIRVIFYMSLVPVGANCITLATELNLDTDDASIIVIISTLISLILIPILTSFQFPFL
jgi:predicted permease